VLALAVAPLTISPNCSLRFPVVSIAPTTLTFAPQVVNPASPAGAPQTATLKNIGKGALRISSIVSSGDFSESDNCPISPTTLPSGATCTLQITFSPNVIGNISGGVTVTGGFGSPHVLALSGVGLPPVGFSPASLDF